VGFGVGEGDCNGTEEVLGVGDGDGAAEGKSTRVFRIARIARVARILKIVKLKNVLQRLEQFAEMVKKVVPTREGDAETWFSRLDKEQTGSISEAAWLLNLKKVPDLMAALISDIDPDTGLLRTLC